MNDQPHIEGARPWIDPEQIRRLMNDTPNHQPLFIGIRPVPEKSSKRAALGLIGILAVCVLVLASQQLFIAWAEGRL